MKPKKLSESNHNGDSSMIGAINPIHKHSREFNMNINGSQEKHIANLNIKSQEFPLPENPIESL